MAEELQSRSGWEREGKVLKFPCSFTAKILTRAKKKTKTAQLIWQADQAYYGCMLYNRELKNHDEVHDDDDVCWLGNDWNENVSFDGKKET